MKLASHIPLYSTEANNVWSCTSTPTHTFMVCPWLSIGTTLSSHMYRYVVNSVACVWNMIFLFYYFYPPPPPQLEDKFVWVFTVRVVCYMCNLSGQHHTPIWFYLIICFKLECYDYKSALGRACSLHGENGKYLQSSVYTTRRKKATWKKWTQEKDNITINSAERILLTINKRSDRISCDLTL